MRNNSSRSLKNSGIAAAADGGLAMTCNCHCERSEAISVIQKEKGFYLSSPIQLVRERRAFIVASS